MLELGPHTGFIVGAYAFTALAIGGLIVVALLDQRAQKRALAAFETATGERRS